MADHGNRCAAGLKKLDFPDSILRGKVRARIIKTSLPADGIGSALAVAGQQDQPEPLALQLAKSGKLWDLAVLLDISRKAMRVVRQNRIVAVITWLVLLPPALGLFHAFGDPFLPPGGALAGQLLAALLTLANSLRA